VDHPVDEETGCARDPALHPAPRVLGDAFGMDPVAQVSVEAPDVEPDRLRVRAELSVTQLEPVGEEAIVHLPEPALGGSGLRRLRGGRRVGVEVRQRKVAEHEAELRAESLEEVQHHGVGLATVGTLEIAVLDQRHGGVRPAAHVISTDVDGRGERYSLHIGTIPSMPDPDDIESEIDRLYALPLDEFVKERDELARSLRKADRRSDAATVKELRKPSVAAWALNQAVRTRRDDLRELLDAGDALRKAQERLLAGGERGELRGATERERKAVSRLAEAAAVIGGEAGRSSTLEPRLQATLHAAALDDQVREELAGGRLVREHEPVALGALAVGEAQPPRRATGAQKAAAPRRPTRRRARGEDPEAKRAEELAELEERVREGRERAEAAAAALAVAEENAAHARERADAAAAEQKEAQRAERAARKAVQDAERAQRAARKAVQEADEARRAARKDVQEAEREAKRLAREAEKLGLK
jgi:hypothetical protein